MGLTAVVVVVGRAVVLDKGRVEEGGRVEVLLHRAHEWVDRGRKKRRMGANLRAAVEVEAMGLVIAGWGFVPVPIGLVEEDTVGRRAERVVDGLAVPVEAVDETAARVVLVVEVGLTVDLAEPIKSIPRGQKQPLMT